MGRECGRYTIRGGTGRSYQSDFLGTRASAIAACQTYDAMMVAFFIKSAAWMLSKGSRFVWPPVPGKWPGAVARRVP